MSDLDIMSAEQARKKTAQKLLDKIEDKIKKISRGTGGRRWVAVGIKGYDENVIDLAINILEENGYEVNTDTLSPIQIKVMW